MKKAFFINGGAGRVLCSIPALEFYKQHVDPSVVIVAESAGELFLSSPILRDNVYSPAHKNLLEEKLFDREIISPEPYRLNAFFNQKCNLIQAFDIIINELSDVPETLPLNLHISKVDHMYGYNMVQQAKQATNKQKVVVFQPFGQSATSQDNLLIDSSGRSFELDDMFDMCDKLSQEYAVILMTTNPVKREKPLGVFLPNQTNLLQWMGIINSADYFLGCDSVGQHISHALDIPSTVVLGSTFPENVSYPDSETFTVIDLGKGTRKYIPLRITQDHVVDRVNEDLMKFHDDTLTTIHKNIYDRLGKGGIAPLTMFNAASSRCTPAMK